MTHDILVNALCSRRTWLMNYVHEHYTDWGYTATQACSRTSAPLTLSQWKLFIHTLNMLETILALHLSLI